MKNIKEKISNFKNKINKKKVFTITACILVAFIFTFVTYNLDNPTYFNRMFANVLNNGTPANSNFEDNTFYQCVIDAYNTSSGNSKAYTDSLTDEELASITNLTCQGWNYSDDDKITSAKGIEKLTGLITLDLRYNQLTNIDLSKNLSLAYLNLSYNQLTSIDLSNNTALTSLNLGYNQLASIDVSRNTALTSLNLGSNQLASIDLSNNTALTSLELGSNQLASIDVSNNTALTNLFLASNQLASIDLSNNTALTSLNLDFNQLASMDVNNNTALTSLSLYYNQLTSIDVSNNTALTSLNLGYNQLTSIDVSNNTVLTSLVLISNQLASIDVSSNTALTFLNLSGNHLTSIDVSNNTALTDLYLSYNQLTSIDLSNNTALTDLYLSYNQLTDIDVSNNTSLTDLELDSNRLTSIDVSNNTALTHLTLNGNPLQVIPSMIIGDTYTISDNIKLPQGKEVTYSIEDETVAKIENGVITALKDGTTRLVIDTGYTSEYEDMKIYIDFVVQSAELSSNIYNINNDLKYIYTRNDADINTIVSNISTNIGEMQIDDDNTLKVKYNDKIISEYKIISYNVTNYNVDGKSIYPVIENFDNKNISVVNGNYEVDNNQNVINIKYGDNIIDTIKLVILKSDEYDLSKIRRNNNGSYYLYKKLNEKKYYDISKITVINGTLVNNIINDAYGNKLINFYLVNACVFGGSGLPGYVVGDYAYLSDFSYSDDHFISGISSSIELTKTLDNNILKIMDGDQVIDSIKVVRILDSKYEFKTNWNFEGGGSKTYINIGDKTFTDDNIKISNGYVKLEDNKLSVYSDSNDLLGDMQLISYQLDYDIINSYGNKYIYLKDKEFDSSKITVNNCEYKIEYNQLTIYSPTTILETINLASINLNGAELKGSSVYLGGMSYLYINGTNCDVNDLGNYIYQVRIDDKVLDTLNIVKINCDWKTSSLINSYGFIYLGARKLSDLSGFEIINGYAEEINNELVIYESEEKEYELKRLKLISISSSKYDLKSGYNESDNSYYVYTGTNKMNINDINVPDELNLVDNGYAIDINIKETGELLEQIRPVYVLVYDKSEYKIVDDDYIYFGLIDKNYSQYINVNNGYGRINDDGDKINIYIPGDNLVATLDIIALETAYLSDEMRDKSEETSEYRYEFESSSLYLGIDSFNPIYITNMINASYEYSTENNIIKVKHNDKIIDEIKVTSIYLPDGYKFVFDTLYLKNGKYDDSMVKSITNIKDVDKNKISVMNGKFIYQKEEEEEDDGTTYTEEWINIYSADYDPIRGEEDDEYRYSKYVSEFGIVYLSSNNYDLSKKYIYLEDKDFENDIEMTMWGEKISSSDLLEMNFINVKDNALEFWYAEEDECNGEYVDGEYVETCTYASIKIDSWDFVRASSDDFDLSTDSIDLGSDMILDTESIDITNGSAVVEGDKLVIKYKDEIIKEIQINGGKKTTTKATTKSSTNDNKDKGLINNIISGIFKTTTTKPKTTTEKETTTVDLKTTKKNNGKKTNKTTTKVITNKNNVNTSKSENGNLSKANIKLLILFLVAFNIIFVCTLYLMKKDENTTTNLKKENIKNKKKVNNTNKKRKK